MRTLFLLCNFIFWMSGLANAEQLGLTPETAREQDSNSKAKAGLNIPEGMGDNKILTDKGVMIVKQKKKILRPGTYLGFSMSNADNFCWMKVVERVEAPNTVPLYKIIMSNDPGTTYEITYTIGADALDGEKILNQSVLKNGKDISGLYAASSLSFSTLVPEIGVGIQAGIQATATGSGKSIDDVMYNGDIDYYNYARSKVIMTDNQFDFAKGMLVPILNIDMDHPLITNKCDMFKFTDQQLVDNDLTLAAHPDLQAIIGKIKTHIAAAGAANNVNIKIEQEKLNQELAVSAQKLEAEIATLVNIDPAADKPTADFISELVVDDDVWERKCRQVGKSYFDESYKFMYDQGVLTMSVTESKPKLDGYCARGEMSRYDFSTTTNYEVQFTGKTILVYTDENKEHPDREGIKKAATVFDISLKQVSQSLTVNSLKAATQLNTAKHCGMDDWLKKWAEKTGSNIEVDTSECDTIKSSFGRLMIKDKDLYATEYYETFPSNRSNKLLQEAFVRKNKAPEEPREDERYFYIDNTPPPSPSTPVSAPIPPTADPNSPTLTSDPVPIGTNTVLAPTTTPADTSTKAADEPPPAAD